MNRPCILICSCVFCLISQAAHAVAVYTYQGNDFDTFFDNTEISGSFIEGQSISVTLTFASPLLNAPFDYQNPLTYSISDGINTMDNTSNPEKALFQFSTNASGEITSWDFIVVEKLLSSTGWSIGDTSRQMLTNSTMPVDEAVNYQCETLFDSDRCAAAPVDMANIVGSPGLWTLTAVPVPGAVWLFGSGLLGLVGVARRMKTV